MYPSHLLSPPFPTSPVEVLLLKVGGDLGLPEVAIVEQLLLVVEQLLVRLGRELKVRALHDRIYGARLQSKVQKR